MFLLNALEAFDATEIFVTIMFIRGTLRLNALFR